MKAWQVHEWCEPEQMKFVDTPVPEPGPDEVRIRNRAAALNFFDILQIQGKYQIKPPFPFTPGAEVAGTIDAIGAEVTRFSIGDRVQALVSSGGYADYSIAPVVKTFRIPTRMSFEEAATLTIIYQTSYFALKYRAVLKSREWLLVHGGASGVGMSAIQIGKVWGARTIATASSSDKRDFCRAQGADYVLNSLDTNWVEEVRKVTEGHGADIIYDPVGSDIFDLSTKCIAFDGRLLIVGFAGGRIPTIAANRILFKNISVVGCYWGGYTQHHPEFLGETQAALFAMYESDQIKPVVSQAYPLADAITALKAITERKVLGKVVLTMNNT
jgi:NADPH2:quinone reductase